MRLKGYKIEFSALDEIKAAEGEPNKFMDKAISLKR